MDVNGDMFSNINNWAYCDLCFIHAHKTEFHMCYICKKYRCMYCILECVKCKKCCCGLHGTACNFIYGFCDNCIDKSRFIKCSNCVQYIEPKYLHICLYNNISKDRKYDIKISCIR